MAQNQITANIDNKNWFGPLQYVVRGNARGKATKSSKIFSKQDLSYVKCWHTIGNEKTSLNAHPTYMNQWNEYWYHCSPINWPLFCTKRGQYTFFLPRRKCQYIGLVQLKYQEKNNASPTFRRGLFSFYQRMTHLLIVYSSLSWLVSACTDSFLVATRMILRQTFEKALCSIHGVHHPKINIWKTFWNIKDNR